MIAPPANHLHTVAVVTVSAVICFVWFRNRAQYHRKSEKVMHTESTAHTNGVEMEKRHRTNRMENVCRIALHSNHMAYKNKHSEWLIMIKKKKIKDTEAAGLHCQ